jgi:hypothetical protein
MNQIWRFVVTWPRTIIATTAAITVFFLAVVLARGIGFNGSPETLARNDSALEFFNQTRATFGDDRVIIAALTTEDVFTPDFIQRLERLTARLSQVEGVSGVLSLANALSIKRQGDEISVQRLIPRAANEVQLRSLKTSVTADPLYAKQYISADGKTTAISVFLKLVDEEHSRAITQEVERIAREEAQGDELLLAGVPVMDIRAIDRMLRDIAVISPVAFLLGFLVFLFAFRSLWGAALPMMTMIVGNLWTVGMMSLLGHPFTFATLTMPTVVMAIGSSYVFHVLNQYRISMSRLEADADFAERARAWIDGVKFIGPAVIVSATTTMAGFGALASSRVPTARDMGMFEAIGVFFLLLLSILFIPAALALLPPHAAGRAHNQEKDYATWLNELLRQVTALILYRRPAVLTFFLLITALTGAGAYRLRVNTDYLNIFPRESEVVQSAEKLHERLAGAASIQVVVSGARGEVADPNFLNALLRLEEFALTQEGVDSALSIADIFKRFNSVFDPASKEPFPSDRKRIETIFDDYLSQTDMVSRVVDGDRSSAVVILRANLFGSNELRGLASKLEEWSKANLPPGVTARPTGSFILLNDASDALAKSQKSSMAIALISIFLMMAILFRSYSTGLLALIPNLLPIVCYYGFLGWMGITLDITTSLVASAALGIAVDNAVHMIRRYRQSLGERQSGTKSDEGWTMWLSVLRAGKPMALANLTLVAANLIFMLSSFKPVRVAGLLWVIVIITSLAADLIFLPALMKTSLFDRIARGAANKAEVTEAVYASTEK